MLNTFSVIIIDSNKERNNAIYQYLENSHYQCTQVSCYSDLEKYYDNNQYDCVLIEACFPKIHIENFLVENKKTHSSITLVLSDTLSPLYLETLLNSGADDYLTIPFFIKDLEKKIQAVYKSGILKPRKIYRFKDLIIDTTAKTLSCNGQNVELTKNEFKLLEILIMRPYQPFSISSLFEMVWGNSLYEDGTSIPGLINNIVRKLRMANEEEDYIKRFGKNNYKMAF